MKGLIGKKKKDSQETPVGLPEQPAQEQRPPLQALLPGLAVAACGLLLGLALLWLVNLNSSAEQHQQQLAQLHAEQLTQSIDAGLRQLQADTQAAASNPQWLEALLAGDTPRIQALQAQYQHWAQVVSVTVNLPGQAELNAQAAAPISFAALDLIRRAESGQNPSPEAFRVGERWLVYSATSIRGKSGLVQGSLLLVVDLQRLLDLWPRLDGQVGQLQLLQQFSNTPEQLLASQGQDSGQPALLLTTSNPHWRLRFSPALYPQAGGNPLPMLGLALLLGLAGAFAGLLLLQRSWNKRLQEDSAQLSQLLQEVAAGKSPKGFSLSLAELDSLARQLVRLPRRSEAPSVAVKPASSASAPGPLEKSILDEELVDPLFQDTDILDIDILDEDQDLLGLDQPSASSRPASSLPAKLPASIFRAYDIRGVVGSSLTRENAYWIGRAIGSESLACGELGVVVGRDGRLSGPELVQGLIQGLIDCGCQVIDIGMVPTPVLYYAANVLQARSGVMLTGSHNPPDYNGFKIVIAGETLANERITALHQRLQNNDLASGVGSVEAVEILDRYFREIRDDIAMAKPMRVVVDCGNGVAGVIAPQLLEALGCSVIPLYCEVDGNFPNHHPDPGKPENLKDLIARVKAEEADLGLAFDGDGDRVGVVTNTGTIVYPDRLLMLFAKDVVTRNPGADVIFDVKCTRRLTALISGYGGRPVMWKTGHSLIKKKMKETGALLAGEMSGHIFFKERWYGFDDGIYSAARLLEILSQERRSAEQVFSAFPNDLCTPELNIEVTDDNKFRLIERLQRDGSWGEGSLTTLDGVRVDYAKGWGLVRASNTTPVLVLRFEAETAEELSRIQELFRAQLYSIAPDLQLPF